VPQKYKLGWADYREVLNTPERLLQEVRFEEQSLMTLLMIVTGILLGDVRALASLPVRARQVFAAKFFAVTLLFSVYSGNSM